MKKILFVLIIALFSHCVYTQEESASIIGKILPGHSYTNTTSDTLVYFDMEMLDKFLILKIKADISERKIMLLQEQMMVNDERAMLSDSAIAVKSAEAEFWRIKLLQNDQQLLESQKQNINLHYENQNIRKSRVYYFIAGVIATSIVFIAVK